MNILYIRPTLNVGGASEHVIRLVEGFAKRGHKVVVVTGGGEWGSRVRPFATYHDNVALLPRVGQSLEIPNIKDLIISSCRVAQIVRKEKIDVISTHHRFAALVGKIPSKLMGIPMVSTMHEVRKDLKRVTALGLGHRVVVKSTFVKCYVVSTYHVQPKKVHVIPMGVHISAPLAADRRASLIKEIGLNHEAPIIGCIARLVKRKGQIHLLNAIPDILRHHPLAQFVFVGEGEERPFLEATAIRLGVTQQVFFVGTRNDVSDLIGLFDFTVLPSLQEEFGNVLIESLAQKKPVVAASVGGIPEIIKSRENGLLVPARDSKALSEGIICLLENPHLVNELGLNGYAMVDKHYSMKSFLDQTEALYHDLLKEMPNRARLL